MPDTHHHHDGLCSHNHFLHQFNDDRGDHNHGTAHHHHGAGDHDILIHAHGDDSGDHHHYVGEFNNESDYDLDKYGPSDHDHNDGITHIDSPSYDDLDGLVGNNPYNH